MDLVHARHSLYHWIMCPAPQIFCMLLLQFYVTLAMCRTKINSLWNLCCFLRPGRESSLWLHLDHRSIWSHGSVYGKLSRGWERTFYIFLIWWKLIIAVILKIFWRKHDMWLSKRRHPCYSDRKSSSALKW